MRHTSKLGEQVPPGQCEAGSAEFRGAGWEGFLTWAFEVSFLNRERSLSKLSMVGSSRSEQSGVARGPHKGLWLKGQGTEVTWPNHLIVEMSNLRPREGRRDPRPPGHCHTAPCVSIRDLAELRE